MDIPDTPALETFLYNDLGIDVTDGWRDLGPVHEELEQEKGTDDD